MTVQYHRCCALPGSDSATGNDCGRRGGRDPNFGECSLALVLVLVALFAINNKNGRV